ncbi:MAG: nucleolar protein,Nop52-domain-containing protein [Olpidium bornovanus]|uniref:Nucleolar protein,Nop52-domain-containing protein n=1 Tax=Olpidium bornovanus TaxID=278681 RepID=A0A8H7ZQJ1_9FUNG|nr:MAG: nucleolar protein,Nop52-domain-containing protein [Olpidium bornovanus]
MGKTGAPAAVDGTGESTKRKRSGSARRRSKKNKGAINSLDGTGPGRAGAVGATGNSAGADPSPFGKRLAHSDKKVRDAALKNLTTWLQHKDLNRLEWLKLWKGLFYCFWMSDKPLVQQELAAKLATLSSRLKKENVWEYVRYFWETLSREWPNIDRLRLDKFYMLMRKILKQSFIILTESDWANDDICRFADIMSRIPLRCALASQPVLLMRFFISIFFCQMLTLSES